MTCTQQREALQLSRLQVEKNLRKISDKLRMHAVLMTAEKIQKLADKRAELKERLAEINAQQMTMNKEKFPWLSSKRDISAFIADIVKERVTKPEWEIIVKEARKRFELFQGAWPGDENMEEILQVLERGQV